jgi:hypothetical protein
MVAGPRAVRERGWRAGQAGRSHFLRVCWNRALGLRVVGLAVSALTRGLLRWVANVSLGLKELDDLGYPRVVSELADNSKVG